MKKQILENEILSPVVSGTLKAIAIWMVIAAHIMGKFWLDNYTANVLGTGGVSLFLILSGYGLYTSYCKNGISLDYWKKKATKVYLPYAAVTLLYAFFVARIFDVDILLKNLLLVDFDRHIDGTMWYISFLLIWYVVFFVLFVVPMPSCIRIVFLFAASAWLKNYSMDYFGACAWQFRTNAFAFPVGVLFAYIAKMTEKKKWGELLHKALMYAAIPMGIIYMILVMEKKASYGVLGIVLFFALYGLGVIVNRPKYIRICLNWLGEHSYILYLVEGKLIGYLSTISAINSKPALYIMVFIGICAIICNVWKWLDCLKPEKGTVKKLITPKCGILMLFVALLSVVFVFGTKAVYVDNVFAKADQNFIKPWTMKDVWLYLIYFVGMLWLALSIQRFYEGKGRKLLEQNDVPQRKEQKKYFLLCWGVLLIAWLPYLLTFFPGAVYSDGFTSIHQVMGSPYSNHHPILYTGFVGIFIKLGLRMDGTLQTGIFLYTVVQIIIMAAVLSYFVIWLRGKRIRRGYCVAVAVFLAVYPMFPFYAVALWKDTYFALALFLFVLNQIDIVCSEGRCLYKKSGIGKYLALAFLVCFLRNNGIYIYLFSLVALGFVYRKRIKKELKRFCLAAVGFGVVTVLIQGPVYDSMGLSTEFVESLGVTNQQIFAVVQDPEGEYSDEDAQFLSKIWDLDEMAEKYTPCLADTPKWYMNRFDQTYLEEHKGEYIKVWLSLGFKNPGIYLDAWLMQTLGFWSPVHSSDVAYIQYGVWSNRYDVEQKDLFAEWFGWSFGEFVRPQRYLSAGLLFEMLLLVTMVATLCAEKGKRWNAFLTVSPIVGLWLTLMIATPIAFSFRYIYVLCLMIPMLPVLPVLVSGEK